MQIFPEISIDLPRYFYIIQSGYVNMFISCLKN